MIVTTLLAALVALAAEFNSQQPSPIPAATASPSSTPAAIPTPAPSGGIATPASSPSPVPSPASAPPIPSPTPTGLNLPPLTYHIVLKPQASAAPDAPQILAIDINSQTVYSGKPLAMRVTTNDAVTKVTISSNGHSGQMTQVAPGRFESIGTIPKLPGIIAGLNVSLLFAATSADGRSTTAKVPIKVHR